MSEKVYQTFSVSRDSQQVVTVAIDVPSRPLNVFDQTVIDELDRIVHDLEQDKNCRAVVFQSVKESGFMAGADVKLISKIESASDAAHLIEVGQQLFDRIEWLPMPTIAVIHGPCLGGGLEWALACDYRIARDNSSTKIGLPEIKLGLIPGWGGTQRLPRLVGLTNALVMILQGKQLSAGEAIRMGLIDRAASPKEWESSIADFVSQVLAGDHAVRTHPKRGILQWLAEKTRTGRGFIFSQTEKRIASKSEHYPALQAALKAVRASYGHRPEGFRVERSEFVRLLATPTCRNLLQIFFDRESARSIQTWMQGSADKDSANNAKESDLHDEPIRKVAVIGAGAMGAGIGQLAACRGYDVVLKEIDETAAQAGRERIDSLMSKLAKRRNMTEQDLRAITDRLHVSIDDNSLSDADLVIEAVVEREDVKHSVFESLDETTPPLAILASNTSSLSVSRMADATQRSHLVAGLHFFNPVHKMELVEVVRAAETSDATIARLVGFVKALGKTPVVTADSPGFLVNRVLFPYLGEAVLMIAQSDDPQHDVKRIDKQIRKFGMPMGPLELLDQVGLDVAMHVARSLDGVLKGVQPVADLLGAMVNRGMLGAKSGSGFYRYRKGRRDGVSEIPTVNVSSNDANGTGGEAPPFQGDDLSDIQRRLIYPMLVEAIRCKQESVVNENWAIDLAMVLGTGFAPHRGGPLRLMDSIGLPVIHQNLQRLESKYGERFKSPELLSQMIETGENFFGEPIEHEASESAPSPAGSH